MDESIQNRAFSGLSYTNVAETLGHRYKCMCDMTGQVNTEKRMQMYS